MSGRKRSNIGGVAAVLASALAVGAQAEPPSQAPSVAAEAVEPAVDVAAQNDRTRALQQQQSSDMAAARAKAESEQAQYQAERAAYAQAQAKYAADQATYAAGVAKAHAAQADYAQRLAQYDAAVAHPAAVSAPVASPRLAMTPVRTTAVRAPVRRNAPGLTLNLGRGVSLSLK